MLNRVDTSFNLGERFNYSTDEKVIGTQIDGKPIYQKVFIKDSDFQRNNQNTIGTLSNGFESIVKCDTFIYTNITVEIAGGYRDSNIYSASEINKTNNNVIVYIGPFSDRLPLKIVAIIQYTKTTD